MISLNLSELSQDDQGEEDRGPPRRALTVECRPHVPMTEATGTAAGRCDVGLEPM
jgi:hypothetical protein